MELNIRRTYALVENKSELAGQRVATPIRKVAVVAVLANPYVGRYVEDLTSLIEASVGLGASMGQMCMEALGPYKAQSYGKGALVGLDGDAEHASALVTTAYANPIRDAIGGGKAWISSMVKLSPPGA